MQDPKGKVHLEVYAELTQSGIAAITQMQNGQLIIGYHPFYLTPTSVQVATLNADRKSSTPYPPAGSGLLQSCRNPDGSFLPAGQWPLRLLHRLGARVPCGCERHPVDPRLGQVDRPGADPVHPRPAALHAKYVGWDTKSNRLYKVIDLDAVTIAAIAAQRLRDRPEARRADRTRTRRSAKTRTASGAPRRSSSPTSRRARVAGCCKATRT